MQSGASPRRQSNNLKKKEKTVVKISIVDEHSNVIEALFMRTLDIAMAKIYFNGIMVREGVSFIVEESSEEEMELVLGGVYA